MTIKTELTIDAPADAIFAVVANPERVPGFVSILGENANVYPADPSVGQSWDAIFAVDGAAVKVVAWCSTYEPSARYAVRTKGALASAWTYTFEPAGTGTRVALEVAPTNDAAASSPLMLAITAQAASWLENLKGLVGERERVTTAP